MRTVIPVVVAVLLGCSGVLSPKATIVSHEARCGVVEGVVESEGFAQTVPLFVNSMQVEELSLASGPAPFALALPAGEHSLKAGTGPVTMVQVPANDLQLRAVASGAPIEGEPAAVAVQVLGSCPTDGLILESTMQATGARRELPLGAGAAERIDLGRLTEGTHDVTLRLLDAGVAVAEASVRVSVGAPCRSGPCRDRDGDGFEGLSVGGTDCDDTQAAVFPGAVDFPDPDGDGAVAYRTLDLDCDGTADVPPGGFDCAEGDPSIPREEDPLPTGVDEDCDGIVDENTTAYDDDGDGRSEEEGDCNDADTTVSPDLQELPDCKDNDCDGSVDEGLSRPTTDDLYEPNDDEAYVLSGAQPRRGPFGGYRPTEDKLSLVVRGLRDVETFSVKAHDGAGDSFHVTAKVLSAGDGLTYRVRIGGPSGGGVEELLGAGGALRHGGRAFGDDSGIYTLRIEAHGETPSHCPLVVELSSG